MRNNRFYASCQTVVNTLSHIPLAVCLRKLKQDVTPVRHEEERLGAKFRCLFQTVVIFTAEIKLEIRIFICRLHQELPEPFLHKTAVSLKHAVPEMGRRNYESDAVGVFAADDRHRVFDGLCSVVHAWNDMTVYIR